MTRNTTRSNKVRRPSRNGALLSTILALFIALVYYVATRETVPVLPGAAQEELGGIHVQGTGGDPALNVQKNRLSAPTTVEELVPRDIVHVADALLLNEGRKMRGKWMPDARAYLNRMESRGVRVTGYIIAAKESGPESCNGYLDSLRDYHLWIGDSASSTKANSIVVEVTPRWKELHPEWRLRYFTGLAKQHSRVRVTGWLLWDEEHANEVDHSRASCWEVHPITAFDVWTSGGWQGILPEFAEK